jgi:hypothetical protein
MMTVGSDFLNKAISVRSEIVYHYTSASVFPVFFNTDSDLYCTNSKCLNDPSEIYLGAKSFAKYLENGNVFDEAHSRLFRCNVEEALADDWFNAWIMSFSERGDDLSQWRGYVDRIEGGFAIGFSTSKLISALKRLTPSLVSEDDSRATNSIPYFAKCWYGGKDEELIEKLYRFIFEKYRSDVMAYSNAASVSRDVIHRLLSTVLPMSIHIKHDAFRDEQEARLVLFAPNCDYSQVKILGNKPRLPLGIPKLGITVSSLIDKVYLSPNGNSDSLMAMAKWLKRKCDGEFEIIKSSIPYDPSR